MTRNAPPYVTALLVLVGLALLVVAGVYVATPAHSLPSFFPGRVGATDAKAGHHHTTHGVAAAILGLVSLVAAWISSAEKAPSRATA